jgi:hypothetical protein
MRTIREDLEPLRLLVKAANDTPSMETNAAVLSAVVAVLTRLIERLEEMEGLAIIHAHSETGDVVSVAPEEREFGRRRVRRTAAL